MGTNKKEAQSHGNYESMLQENNKKLGLKPDNTSTYNYELQIQRKGNDPTAYEKRMQEKRTGSNDTITEKSLNQNDKVFNEKRNSETWDKDALTINILEESYDQNKTKAIKEAEEKDRDTGFWDDYVGVQMISPKTTITNNVQESQLENASERFADLQNVDMSNLKPDEAINSVLEDVNKVKKMVFASLNDADAMLFNIYYKSANRDLTKEETQMVKDINSAKIRIIAQQQNPGRYERVVFLERSEADEAFKILDDKGEDAVIEYLSQMHNPGEHGYEDDPGFGRADNVYRGNDGYILSYNIGLGYIALAYDTENDEVINDDKDDYFYRSLAQEHSMLQGMDESNF